MKIFGIRITCEGDLFGGLKDGACEALFKESAVDNCYQTKKNLDDCKPWREHLTAEGIKDFGKYTRQKKYDSARVVLEKALTDGHDKKCIAALKLAVTLVSTKCPMLLRESLPGYYYF